jgi:hypothetical protein
MKIELIDCTIKGETISYPMYCIKIDEVIHKNILLFPVEFPQSIENYLNSFALNLSDDNFSFTYYPIIRLFYKEKYYWMDYAHIQNLSSGLFQEFEQYFKPYHNENSKQQD